MGELNLLQSQVGVSPVEECTGILGIQRKGFVIFLQTLVIEPVVVKGECLVIVVSSLRGIQLYRLLKTLQGHVILLVLEVRQPQIVLGRSVILYSLAGPAQVSNALGVLLDLAVAVAPVEEGLEVGVPRLNVLKALREVLYSRGKIHEPGVHEASVEVVETILRLHRDRLMELGEGVVNLVEHHHAVAAVRIILRIISVEADSRSEVVHGFLVVPDRHEGLSPFRVVSSMG